MPALRSFKVSITFNSRDMGARQSHTARVESENIMDAIEQVENQAASLPEHKGSIIITAVAAMEVK